MKEKNGREDNWSEGEGSRGDRRKGEGIGGDGRENNRSEGEGSGGDMSEGDRREGVGTECDGRDRKKELFCSSDRGGEEESEGVCGGFDS